MPSVDDDVMVVIRDTKDQKEYIDKKGIHVIVGQYVGNSGMAWDTSGSPNLTKGTSSFLSHPRSPH